MLGEICIRRRAGSKYESGSTLDGCWTILQALTHRGSQVSDGCYNRGIKLVEEISTGQLCVLKMLPPDIICPGHATREIRILRDIVQSGGKRHANIVQFQGSDEGSEHPHDIPWLVTDFCNSGTLAQLVQTYEDEDRSLPEAFLWHTFEGLAQALRFCHERGIVHRDITLSNIFLHSDNLDDAYPLVRLADFGCATWSEDTDGISLGDPSPGNPRFSPPEGFLARTACDVYQLGLAIFCLYMANVEPIKNLADLLHEEDQHEQIYTQELRDLMYWCMATEGSKRPSAAMVVRKVQDARQSRRFAGSPPLLGGFAQNHTMFQTESQP